MYPSSPPVAKLRPSGLNAHALMGPKCPRTLPNSSMKICGAPRTSGLLTLLASVTNQALHGPLHSKMSACCNSRLQHGECVYIAHPSMSACSCCGKAHAVEEHARCMGSTAASVGALTSMPRRILPKLCTLTWQAGERERATGSGQAACGRRARLVEEARLELAGARRCGRHLRRLLPAADEHLPPRRHARLRSGRRRRAAERPLPALGGRLRTPAARPPGRQPPALRSCGTCPCYRRPTLTDATHPRRGHDLAPLH